MLGDGANLLVGYKRAANILKKENWDLPRVMAGKGEQGIPQTGEEDPLSEVEEPAAIIETRRPSVSNVYVHAPTASSSPA